MYSSTSQSVIPKSYSCRTFEGNWYEDRCTSDYDRKYKKNYSLKGANAWQYQTTTSKIGEQFKTNPKLVSKFSQSSDNYINFQTKKNDMYATVYKKSYNEKYLGENVKPNTKDYYLNKQEELTKYREKWTKRAHQFETTYKEDLLTKTFFLKK